MQNLLLQKFHNYVVRWNKSSIRKLNAIKYIEIILQVIKFNVRSYIVN